MARWSARVSGYAKSGSGTGNVEFTIAGIIADSEYEAREIILSKAASMKPKHENFRIIEIHQIR